MFELRSKLGIVSADLHDRFVHGNSNGVLTGLDAVVSGFFATHGLFAHQRVTEAMRRPGDGGARARRRRAAGGRHARHDVHRRGAARADRAGAGPRARGARARRADARARPGLAPPFHGARARDRARRERRSCWSRITSTRSSRRSTRVILLRRGRIDRDGAKSDVLTAEALSRAFDAPLSVEEAGGYFHVRVS